MAIRHEDRGPQSGRPVYLGALCLLILIAAGAHRAALVQTQKSTPTAKSREGGASLDDTIDFIVGKLNGSQATWSIREDKAVSTSTQSYDVIRDGTSLVITERQRLVHEQTDAEVTQETSWTIHLADIAAKTCIVAQIRGEAVAVYLVLSFSAPQLELTTNAAGNKVKTTPNEIMITVENRAIAERLLKAFQHAGPLAGAKKEVF